MVQTTTSVAVCASAALRDNPEEGVLLNLHIVPGSPESLRAERASDVAVPGAMVTELVSFPSTQVYMADSVNTTSAVATSAAMPTSASTSYSTRSDGAANANMISDIVGGEPATGEASTEPNFAHPGYQGGGDGEAWRVTEYESLMCTIDDTSENVPVDAPPAYAACVLPVYSEVEPGEHQRPKKKKRRPQQVGVTPSPGPGPGPAAVASTSAVSPAYPSALPDSLHLVDLINLQPSKCVNDGANARLIQLIRQTTRQPSNKRLSIIPTSPCL
ncbi:hypothetical protein CALCODRAFT_488499 [Calocera cornea HHB12733]|uniref:Uncharacterized protein n=1 Tax=Calocera cornea HHB12733 TaxID=1353952 RepID=A0A165CFL5_9BASI|nr:hypothetical protein CALCODRAFT_488499 [Calocera cornea HHB12733]